MDKLKQDLLQLIDPSVMMTLEKTGGLSHLGLDEESDVVLIEVLVDKKIPATDQLRSEIIKLVKIKYGHKGIKLTINEKKVRTSIANTNIPVIGIISGKGGVGKSSVASNIAYRFMKKGYQTALIDADIYGSSIPDLLGIAQQEMIANDDEQIIPLKYENMEVMSTDFFTNHHEPVIWRAGMLHSMLEYFFNQTAWDPHTKVIIVDFPPGTGDIMLDFREFCKNPKMLLVTTPHPAAAIVAIKAGIAAKKMNQDLVGIIENMAYFEDEQHNKHYVFGKDGGLNASSALMTPLLAQIPLAIPTKHQCLFDIAEPNGKIYNDIVDYLIYTLEITK